MRRRRGRPRPPSRSLSQALRDGGDQLAKLIAKRRVSCESRGTDKYDRGHLLRRRRSIDARDGARRFSLGIREVLAIVRTCSRKPRRARHASASGRATPSRAWVYREKRWADAEQEAPKGCAIEKATSRHGTCTTCRGAPLVRQGQGRGDEGRASVLHEVGGGCCGWRPAAVG